jgi:ankyrin repeat protein
MKIFKNTKQISVLTLFVLYIKFYTSYTISHIVIHINSYSVGRVCQLVAAGLSINSFDSEESRNTPLHWAASYGNKDIVSCLIGM